MAGVVATWLPVVEIAVGIALVPSLTARFGAVGAGVLLAVFTAAIVRSLARGERDRNERAAREHRLDLVLLDELGERAADAYRAHGTPMAVLIAPDGTIASQTVAGADAIATLVAAAIRPVPEPEPSVRIGEPAPALVLRDLAGDDVPLADLYDEPIVALFWNPNCGFCRQMLPLLHAFEQGPPAGTPRVVVISSGHADPSARGTSATAVKSRPG